MKYKESSGGVILNERGEVAIVAQEGRPDYSLPKGSRKAGETGYEAALREIREETGLTEAQLELVGYLGSYLRNQVPHSGKSGKVVKEIRWWQFTTEAVSLVPQDPKIEVARFAPPDEAVSLMAHPRDREFLESLPLEEGVAVSFA